ncbi:Ros/MucR family transcriptional regulator [Sphingobium agri]|uniref:MucR family transcriptional regulator n=1 Tax=Sphingobium agri TaxID=2933566 RepID=A0ABT0E053_9SPHN|nr:MucR family transcriptional regulator [Sphingobium agri]MCK0532757.1 MucR family transcriptional regulator [Sphingobium agri]
MSEESQPDITTLTVQLLSAFVSNNSVTSEGLAELIRTTRIALTEDPAADANEAQAATYTPAVSVRKSLSSPDHILSMIDGKPYKTLKRHLATHGLSPDEYRERYNLPKSYPLVAPSYSEARRAVATRLGLGRKPAAANGGEKAAAPKQADAAKAAAADAGDKAPARKAAKPAKPAKAAAKPAAKASPAKAADAAGGAEPKAAKAPRKARAKAAPAPAETNS